MTNDNKKRTDTQPSAPTDDNQPSSKNSDTSIPQLYTTMEDIQLENIDWLWYPYIPYGKITIMHGDGGDGKTFVSLAIASAVTIGGLLPECDEPLEPSNVIFQTAEDGYGDTIKPRLMALGADCLKVIVINEENKSLSLTDNRLEQVIIENNVKLVILDPIQAYLGADVDMHRANEVRPVLKHLGNVAHKTGCAIVLIGHLNKSGGSKSQYRGLGSIDITAAARSVLVFGKVKSEDNPDLRAFVQSKANLAPSGIGMAYELSIEKGFNWLGAYEITADDLLDGINTAKTPKKVDEASDFLYKLLKENPLPSKEVARLAGEQGITEKTLQRAKSIAKVSSYQQERSWYWVIN